MNIIELAAIALLISPALVMITSNLFHWVRNGRQAEKRREYLSVLERLDKLVIRMNECHKAGQTHDFRHAISLDIFESAVERAEITIKVILKTKGWREDSKFIKDIMQLIKSCERRIRQYEDCLKR